MDNKLFPKFSLYDQIGYILVGSIASLVISFDVWLLKNWIPKIGGLDLIILVIVVYFLGHLIQSLANLVLREKTKDFSEDEKKTLNIAKENYNLKEKTDNEVYRFVSMLSLTRDFSGQVEAFNAYYSLYRGWFITFVGESIFLLYYLICVFNFRNVALMLISIIISILFYLRLKRFYKYCREKTLYTFLIISRV